MALGRVRCERCAERIRRDAKVCRYCGHERSDAAAHDRTREPATVAQASAQPTDAAAADRDSPARHTDARQPAETVEAAAPTESFATSPASRADEPAAAPRLPERPSQHAAPAFLPPTARTPAATPADSDERRGPLRGRPWYRSWWVRGPVLAVVVFDAGLRLLDPDEWVQYAIPVRIAAGVAIALGVMMVYGLLAWGVARLFKRHPRYWDVVLSFPMMLFIFLGSLGIYINRDEQHPNHPGILSAQTSSDNSTDGDTANNGAGQAGDQRRAEFADWMRDTATAIGERGAASRRFIAWSKMDNTASPAAMSRLRSAERHAAEHERLTERLLANDDTRAPNQLLSQSAREFHRCVTATRRVMQTLDQGNVEARADAADKQCQASDRHIRAGVKEADDAFNRLGGAEKFPGLGDETRALAEAASQK
jgi:hypothetical protein